MKHEGIILTSGVDTTDSMLVMKIPDPRSCNKGTLTVLGRNKRRDMSVQTYNEVAKVNHVHRYRDIARLACESYVGLRLENWLWGQG